MRAFLRLTLTDVKLYLREPIAMFFTIAFPPLLVLLLGMIFGNEPTPELGGLGNMDVAMPAFTALIVGMIGLIPVPITITDQRSKGVLRRYRATPMRPLAFIGADVVCNLVMTFVGMAVLLVVGALVFHVSFEGSVAAVLLAVTLGALSMFSIGYLIASVAPNPRAANVIGMVIFYPMVYLCGTAMPTEFLPETVQRIAEFLPLTYVVRLLRGLWTGGSLADFGTEIAVLVGVLVVATALAARLFRWD